mmetsp:Transcript_115426/g.337558  ORF Transcript_115426/g.337558 Transcript_115426/m.337558 type:complete len:219 (-) Transcript_115426:271-927(-)
MARSRGRLESGTPGSSMARTLRIFSTWSALGSMLYSARVNAMISSFFKQVSLSTSNFSKTSRFMVVVFSSVLRRGTTAALSSSIFFLHSLIFPCRAKNSGELFVFLATSELPISLTLSLTALVAACTATTPLATASSVACAASTAFSCVISLMSAVSGFAASTAAPALSSSFVSSSRAALASSSTFSGSGAGPAACAGAGTSTGAGAATCSPCSPVFM